MNEQERNEKLGYKMREAQIHKIPLSLVIGDNEINNHSVNYRYYGSKESTEMKLDEFIDFVVNKINNKE